MYTNFTIFDACYYKNENIPYTDRMLRIHFRNISFFYFLWYQLVSYFIWTMQNLSSLSQLTDDDIITYGSNLTIAEYNALLNSKRDVGLQQLISSLNLSLRNTTVNNLAAMFPIQRQKTPTIYNAALNGLRHFLQRVGDYDSLLALHPQAPIQVPSANITYIPLYY